MQEKWTSEDRLDTSDSADCNGFFLSCRVQETDGSFFESFTALSWKHENRRLMAMQEVEGRAEDPPPSEKSVGIKPMECRIHKKEVRSTEFSLVSQGGATLMSVRKRKGITLVRFHCMASWWTVEIVNETCGVSSLNLITLTILLDEGNRV